MGRGGKERCRRVSHPPCFAPSIKGAGLPLLQALNTCQARDAVAVSKESLTQIRIQGTAGPRNYGGEGRAAFRALKILAHGFWKHLLS